MHDPGVQSPPRTDVERLRSSAAAAIATAARAAIEAFTVWIDDYGPLSQDPYDLWATSLGRRAKELYYRRPLLGALAAAPFVGLDLVAPRARFLVRPAGRSPISDAHYALGFFELARVLDDEDHGDTAQAFLEALDRSRSTWHADPAWGYPFDWPTRVGLFHAGTPFITTIPYCYEAFEAGYGVLGDKRYLETMRGVARFAAEQIPVIAVGPESEASAYSPIDGRKVINASAYRGFLLATSGRRFARDDWVEAGARNIRFVVEQQRADGSWPYALDGEDFVDNFHTCLVLKNLAKFWLATGDDDSRAAFCGGYDFYLAHLLDDSGLPVPFARRPRVTLHRRDLYDYAEGIAVALLLRDEVPAAQRVLEQIVGDLVARWQLPDGHFVTRELAVGRNTVPYHRWAQSQVFHALTKVVADGR
jgi:hypothetical protein